MPTSRIRGSLQSGSNHYGYFGNVVNAWCDPYGLYSIWGVNTGCKSSSRGAFLSWKTTTGIFDQSFIARLDSSGNFDFFSQVQDYFYGDYNEVAGILPLPDSTYFIINNVTPIMTWPNMKTIVARMNENGTVIWQKEFRSASTGYQYLQFIYATTDGFGNIYIIGVVNEDSFCIIKIDLYGNQLFSKLWKYPSPSLGTLHFPIIFQISIKCIIKMEIYIVMQGMVHLTNLRSSFLTLPLVFLVIFLIQYMQILSLIVFLRKEHLLNFLLPVLCLLPIVCLWGLL